jgi:hypothetical protein
MRFHGRLLAVLAFAAPFGLAAIGYADEPAVPQPVSVVTNPASQTVPGDKLAATRVVWVTSNGKYHCPADLWFGRTHDGQYMAEDDARAKGYRHEKGKVCNAPV